MPDVLLVSPLTVFCTLLNRFFDRNQGERGAAWLPVAFLVVQLTLVNIMILLPFVYIGKSMRYYVVSVALSLVGLAADLLLFVAMDRFIQKRNDDARAAILEEQLDRYLVRYGELVAGIERTLKMRHDAGSHAQVVLALAERGEFQEAHGHLVHLNREFASFEDEEEDTWS